MLHLVSLCCMETIVKIKICGFRRSYVLELFLEKEQLGAVTVCSFLQSRCHREFARYGNRDQNLCSPTHKHRSTGRIDALLFVKK